MYHNKCKHIERLKKYRFYKTRYQSHVWKSILRYISENWWEFLKLFIFVSLPMKGLAICPMLFRPLVLWRISRILEFYFCILHMSMLLLWQLHEKESFITNFKPIQSTFNFFIYVCFLLQRKNPCSPLCLTSDSASAILFSYES